MDPPSAGGRRDWPTLTLTLTALMLVVYAAEFLVHDLFGAGWYGILFVQHPDYWYWPLFWTPFTNLISHNIAKLSHIVNLVFFVPLGWWAEQRFPRGKILAAFFFLGAVASTLQVSITQEPASGSSAAITVLAGAWFMEAQMDRSWDDRWRLFSWALAITAILPLALPDLSRKLVIGFEGIGHWSHFGGFVLGVAAYPLFLRPSSNFADPESQPQ